MEKNMSVTIGIVVKEEDVKDWLEKNGENSNEITEQDYIDYVETKYNQGLGCNAKIC